jgi:type II secretory pathway pseudopilin PulG
VIRLQRLRGYVDFALVPDLRGLRLEFVAPMICKDNDQRGFTYLGVLIAIALIGLALGLAGESWRVSVKRDKEQDLLFIGHEFRHAISNYYYSSPGAARQFPASLEDLLKDPRFVDTRRYLRRVYPDPLTGKTKWGLISGANNSIMGVYSLSEEEPIKQANFTLEDAEFEGKRKYQDWKFVVSEPPATPQQAAPSPK